MAGRLAQFTPPVADVPEDWKPAWNISPGQRLLILRKVDNQLECARVLWNLTPAWLKDLSRTPFSINAEVMHDKPMFRQPLVERRCLIPVDGARRASASSPGICADARADWRLPGYGNGTAWTKTPTGTAAR